jgi:hypothetical protein
VVLVMWEQGCAYSSWGVVLRNSFWWFGGSTGGEPVVFRDSRVLRLGGRRVCVKRCADVVGDVKVQLDRRSWLRE